MVFNSAAFLFLFLPALLAVYFIVPKKLRTVRNLILLAASLSFYFYGEPKAILILLTSILGNYLLALGIGAAGRRPGSRKLLLVCAAVFNLGILGYFKYAGFLVENLNLLAGGTLTVPQIALPLGISFFTFQSMSYVFDVYRGTVPAQRNLLHVALYLALFPELVSGPIARYGMLSDAFDGRSESAAAVSAGIRRFIVGLSKKVIVADSIGALTAELFKLDPAVLGTGEAWLGAVAYTLQIYLDFSGYTDMAIGLAQIFGFTLPENFNYPYISRSVTEFWRRWHMSLSSWFRDYVYIPLGGNRRGLPRQLLNILIVWMLTGLWHGAAWNFVLWGLYFALLLAAEKLFLGKLLDRLPRFAGHIYALLAIVAGWVIFNSADLASALSWLSAMFTPTSGGSGAGAHALYLLYEYKAELLLGALISLPIARAVSGKFGDKPAYRLARDIIVCGMFMVSIACVISSTFNPFIYFRF